MKRDQFQFKFLFLTILFQIYCDQPLWDDKFNFEEIEHKLNHEKILQAIPLTDFLTKSGQQKTFICSYKDLVYLVTLESGLKCIFKIRKNINFINAEIAAYKASRLLNFNFVPPVSHRIYNNLHGSLHFFINFEYKTLNDQDTLYKQLSPKTQSEILIFRFIFGQFDAHKGNIIIQKNERPFVALIDNESLQYIQIANYGEKPLVLFSPITDFCLKENLEEFSNLSKLVKPKLSQIKSLFSNYLAKQFTSREVQKLTDYFSNRNEINYKIIQNTLWIKLFRNYEKALNYYQTTLDNIKKIDKNFLKEIWKSGMQKCNNINYFETLFDMVLQRRNQVLDEAKNHLIISDN